MTEDGFRIAYPVFADVVDYPSTVITGLMALAKSRLMPDIWQDTLEQGIGLYAAHSLVMWKRQTTLSGANAGAVSGVQTSATVGPVSAGYDLSYNLVKDGGYWNLTGFGQEFVYLARMVGGSAPAQFYG